MTFNSQKSEESQINRVTLIGMAANAGLGIIKLLTGYLIGSLALVADGYHSFSDLGTDLVVLFGAAMAGRPPDRSHPYGHGKFETFSTWVISAVLIVVGGILVWEGFKVFVKPAVEVESWWVIIAALLSLGIKEVLYRMTIKVAIKCRSSVLRANAWHHRSDALSSAVVLLSGLAGLFGFYRGDAIAGILVGFMIIAVGVKLGYEAMRELSEASPGREIENQVQRIIAENKDIRGWHRLRMRRIGREIFMDIHILLDQNLSILKGHEITEDLEGKVDAGLGWPINLTIHIDPDTDEIRNASRRRDSSVIR